MARFVDLDQEGVEEGAIVREALARDAQVIHVAAAGGADAASNSSQRELYHGIVTDALQCWPVVMAIVSSLDLNSLDALARTSRRIHDSLIQYRKTLMAATLRCCNEEAPVDPTARHWSFHFRPASTTGRAGSCARDMVKECRRCGHVVCRNCAIKPPAPNSLKKRHRRLCTTCVSAPIAALARTPLPPELPLQSGAVQGVVCKCASDGVWLCQQCGRTTSRADHEYSRIWAWRNHYGEVLGGLGTGIGDGDRGVICGRDDKCFAAKEREHEEDCDAVDVKDSHVYPWTGDFPTPGSHSSTPTHSTTNILLHNHHANNSNNHSHGNNHNDNNDRNSSSTNNHQNDAAPAPLFASAAPLDVLVDDSARSTPSPQSFGPGYERHEIEGIGGVVKRKLVRMVRVGACVPEWEDEKGPGTGRALRREMDGEARSWCGWCWRVIPGKEDLERTT